MDRKSNYLETELFNFQIISLVVASICVVALPSLACDAFFSSFNFSLTWETLTILLTERG